MFHIRERHAGLLTITVGERSVQLGIKVKRPWYKKPQPVYDSEGRAWRTATIPIMGESEFFGRLPEQDRKLGNNDQTGRS